MATSQNIPYWMTDASWATQPGAMSGTMSEGDAAAEYQRKLAQMTAANRSSIEQIAPPVASPQGSMAGGGGGWGGYEDSAPASSPAMSGLQSMVSSGPAAPAPIAMPQLAQEAPDIAPPQQPQIRGYGGGGGESPTPPGQITAPGSMRDGIGRRTPPSLAALLKPRVY